MPLWRKRGVKPDPMQSTTPPVRHAVPQVLQEDAPDSIRAHRQFSTWMDEVVSRHQEEGGFDFIDGRGKPLQMTDDGGPDAVLNRLLKNANVLPPWLELQHLIRDDIGKLIQRVDNGTQVEIAKELERINQKIRKFNQQCPHDLLRKLPLTHENWRQQFTNWM